MNEVPIQCYSSRRKGRGKGPSFGNGRRGRFLMTGSELKFLGIVFMALDHIGVVLIERGILKSSTPALMRQIVKTASGKNWWYADCVLRYIGRLAFPIFLFFLVEGFMHTRHKKDYGKRLLFWAVFSEIPFDLAIFGTWFYPDYQNILFTLFFAYVTLCAVQAFRRYFWLQVFSTVLGCFAAWLFKVDYGAAGILIAVLLYWFRGSTLQLEVGAAACAVESINHFGFSALAFILLSFYRGERGMRPGKYFFYLFYPAHLFFLFLLYSLLVYGGML